MNPHEYRLLFVCLAIVVVFWGSIVLYQEFNHPASRAADHAELQNELLLPKTTVKSQLTYAKDHEREWAEANSGDRSKSLPAWSKILNNFRLNVVGTGSENATASLKASEAWWGRITGDANLDSRLIEASVMTNLYGEGRVWKQLDDELKRGASNEEIDQTLSLNKF